MNKLILATSSPRRKELFEKFNIDYMAVNSNIIERLNPDDEPLQYAMRMAFLKAYSVSRLYEKDIVIGTDTIVVLNNEILGKPRDQEDAFRMLKLLSGNHHEVISGISLINLASNTKIVDYDITKVKFRNLSDDTILKYIDTKEPLDKSGGYGIQGFGGLLVESIVGSYYNVIGLPLVKLDELLMKYFDFSII
ncbi:MAG: septum formation protein Maf [Tissierella sp.]|nr:septum formation protein Maf [Tissierella sp.]